MFQTPDKKQNHKHVFKSYTCTSSTPHNNVVTKINTNISLSTIDSSSGDRSKKILPLYVSEKHKKRLKKKKKINKRKRISIQFSDNESETASKHPINNSPKDLQVCSSKKHDDNLFEYLNSPEKVRDVPLAYEFQHNSPIIQSSRRLLHISKENDNMQYNELLPVLNLPLTEVQDVCPAETQKHISSSMLYEDEPIFHKENNMRTYPLPQKWKKRPKIKLCNLKVRTRFPTARSDLLWDDFINKFGDDVSPYLASPSVRVPVELTNSKRGLPDIQTHKSKINQIPEGMECDWGYWHKLQQKWISFRDECNSEQENESETDKRKTKIHRKYKRKRKEKTTVLQSTEQKQRIDTLYDLYEETDTNDIKKITYSKFRRKQKMNKSVPLPTSFH